MNDTPILLDWADLPALEHEVERIRTDWIFAYGSLIWDPGFDHLERHRVTIHGYHRAFCIRSVQYRGTEAAPGVVLGLDRGGSCQGVVFRLVPDQADDVLELIYRREMSNRSYHPRIVRARLADGRRVDALTFVARRDAPSYQHLDEAEVLRRLRDCAGARGPNCDYAINTVKALADWGIHDARLARLVHRLGPRAGGSAAAPPAASADPDPGAPANPGGPVDPGPSDFPVAPNDSVDPGAPANASDPAGARADPVVSSQESADSGDRSPGDTRAPALDP